MTSPGEVISPSEVETRVLEINKFARRSDFARRSKISGSNCFDGKISSSGEVTSPNELKFRIYCSEMCNFRKMCPNELRDVPFASQPF